MFWTTFNYISLCLLGEEPDIEAISKARNRICDHDGVTSILSLGKMWLSVLYMFLIFFLPTLYTLLLLMVSVHLHILIET